MYLCYLSFFSKDEIIGLIFLSVLIYHMLKLLRRAASSKKKMKMTKYVKALKYTSLCVIVITELLKSINTNYLKSIKIDSKIDDGFHKICNQIKEGYVGNFMGMLIIVLLFLYLKRVKLGARLDFFDVHLNENMKKIYLYQSQWRKNEDIKRDSLFAGWFTRKVIRMYSLTDEALFTETAKFKPKFIKEFCRSSKIMFGILEVIRQNHIIGMNRAKRFKVKIYKLYQWIKNAVLYFFSMYLAKILLVIINIYSCFYFLFYTQKPEYLCVLHFTLLYWNLCSMVVTDPLVMKYLSFILIFPPYIIDMGQIYYMGIYKKFFKFKEDNKNYISSIMYPHS